MRAARGLTLGLLASLAACRSGGGAASPELVTRAEASARRAIADERSLSAASLPQRSVGVLPLDANANDTTAIALAYGLADLLTTDLARSAQVQVVERVRTDALLRELSLAESGRTESATAPRVGRLIGARRVVIGAVATQGARFQLNMRVADVATTQVQPALSTTVALDAVLDAEKEAAFRLFDQLGVTLTPAERALVEQRPTRNVGAFLAYGRGVRAEAVGDFRSARGYYRQAVSIDPSFVRASAGAERTDAVTAARGDALSGGSSALRAASATNESLNRPINANYVTPRSADAAFPLQQLITLRLTINVP